MRDSSEHDGSMETPTSPAADADEAQELPADELPVPVPAPAVAAPGLYWCDDDHPGEHPILGLLLPGENDFREVTDLRQLQAIAACCATGLLEPIV
jgi:hypothetical protein